MIRAHDALYEGLYVHGMLAALLASAKPYLQGIRPECMDPRHLFRERRSGSVDLLEVPDLGSRRFRIENQKVQTTLYTTKLDCLYRRLAVLLLYIAYRRFKDAV